jgi:endonuclease YncB( thermonuclease family)
MARHIPLLIIAFLVIGAIAAPAATIEGTAIVTDGDTIVIGQNRIRLQGIDAPETHQICLGREGKPFPCGLRARDALVSLIGKRSVTCQGDEIDRYGRQVMTCSVDGHDVNAEMVGAGWALAFVRYSDRYVAHERDAREHSRGLWAGAFIAPWDWRHRGPTTVVLGSIAVPIDAQSILLPSNSAAANPITGCTIKGNISRSGERIYHLPGMRDYDKVRISERNGERWFCTEDEARAAGWRKAYR